MIDFSKLPRVFKSGGKYGGPGYLFSEFLDEHGDPMAIVGHRIAGGYGMFKHVYPRSIVLTKTTATLAQDITARIEVAQAEALALVRGIASGEVDTESIRALSILILAGLKKETSD